ncbi:MAG: hypothetical protein WC690_04665, partial [bacterium]
MKRTGYFAIAAFFAAILIAAAASAQEFSKPILIGGDNPGTPQEKQTSQATHLKFFSHPKTPPNAVNFTDDTGQINFPTPQPSQDVFIGDVAATPGFIFSADSAPINADSQMLDHPKP